MSSNISTIADEDGDFEDWIEIYNPTDMPLSTLGYYLSDRHNNIFMWAFPDLEIEAEGFLLVFASGKDRRNDSILHTNFSINNAGEYILLSYQTGQIIDHYLPIELSNDYSYGSVIDGDTNQVKFTVATPGFSNSYGTVLLPESDTIVFSHTTGLYTNGFELNLAFNADEYEIRYTLDGSDPTIEDSIYTEPILIEKIIDTENVFSAIPTNPASSPQEWVWKAPENMVFKATIIKAKAFYENLPISHVTTHSYFVADKIKEKYSFPIISLVAEPQHLFGYEEGIYVPGKTHSDNPSWVWGWGTGNYHNRGDQWERQANMAYIDENGVIGFHQNIGVRIHGGGSRSLPLKTLRIYAKGTGNESKIEFPILPSLENNDYRRFLLRNSGQDFSSTMFRDAFTHELVKNLDMEIQYWRPVIVFINGEYWGIHNIRERIDKYYLQYRKNVNPDNIDLITYSGAPEAEEGSYTHFESLISYIEENGIEQESHYQYIKSSIDIANYIDYMVSKIYFGVYDWPGNNVRFWREREANSKYRWIMYDNDDAFVNPYINTLQHALELNGEAWPNPPYSTFLFRKLLENEAFKQQFISRFAFLLQNNFKEATVLHLINAFEQIYEKEIEEHIERWSYPESVNVWRENIENFRVFAKLRPCILRNHFIEQFNLSEEEFLSSLCSSGFNNVESQSEIKVFPNPNTGQFSFNFIQKNISNTTLNIFIYNLLGQEVYRNSVITIVGENNISIVPDKKLASGSYMLKISNTEIESHAWFNVFE